MNKLEMIKILENIGVRGFEWMTTEQEANYDRVINALRVEVEAESNRPNCPECQINKEVYRAELQRFYCKSCFHSFEDKDHD